MQESFKVNKLYLHKIHVKCVECKVEYFNSEGASEGVSKLTAPSSAHAPSVNGDAVGLRGRISVPAVSVTALSPQTSQKWLSALVRHVTKAALCSISISVNLTLKKYRQRGGLSGRTSLGDGSLVSFILCAPVQRAQTTLSFSALRAPPPPRSTFSDPSYICRVELKPPNKDWHSESHTQPSSCGTETTRMHKVRAFATILKRQKKNRKEERQ